MDFYIDLIIYIFAVIGIVVTNIAFLERYFFVSSSSLKFKLNRNNVKKRYVTLHINFIFSWFHCWK